MRRFFSKFKRKTRDKAERISRAALLDQLFNDFNRSRVSVYKLNFFRGIFFGLGSVIGGTVVIALLVWLLNVTGHLIPGLSDFIRDIVQAIQSPSV